VGQGAGCGRRGQACGAKCLPAVPQPEPATTLLSGPTARQRGGFQSARRTYCTAVPHCAAPEPPAVPDFQPSWRIPTLDVGTRLKTIRKLKGLSQRELAKRAGVTNSTISMIEKNSVSPSVSSLKKVLGGIPMSLVEFFSLESAQAQPRKVVYRADELLDIGSNQVIMQLVGKDHPGRSISFLREVYPPAADT